MTNLSHKKADCVFCKIVKGELPSYKIYENEDCYAFLSTYPVCDGHTLVIPKKHMVDLSTCDDDLLKKTIISTKKVQSILQKKLNPSGFNYVSNEKAVAYQVIFHFHIHVLPKYEKDKGFLLSRNIDNQYTLEEVHKIVTT